MLYVGSAVDNRIVRRAGEKHGDEYGTVGDVALDNSYPAPEKVHIIAAEIIYQHFGEPALGADGPLTSKQAPDNSIRRCLVEDLTEHMDSEESRSTCKEYVLAEFLPLSANEVLQRIPRQ